MPMKTLERMNRPFVIILLANAGGVTASGLQLGAVTTRGFSSWRRCNGTHGAIVACLSIRLDLAGSGRDKVEPLQHTRKTRQLAACPAVGLNGLMNVRETLRHRDRHRKNR